MNAEIEVLWHRLLEFLRSSGQLPLANERLTPAEIARHIKAASTDRRVDVFVWSYFYPRLYGNKAGELTDEQAAALVESITGRSPPDDLVPRSTNTPSVVERLLGVTCAVCQRRAAREIAQ
jgi:hypothetical protein